MGTRRSHKSPATRQPSGHSPPPHLSTAPTRSLPSHPVRPPSPVRSLLAFVFLRAIAFSRASRHTSTARCSVPSALAGSRHAGQADAGWRSHGIRAARSTNTEVGVEPLGRRFEMFRRSHEPGTRTPDTLRAAALARLVRGASSGNLFRTCRETSAQLSQWRRIGRGT